MNSLRKLLPFLVYSCKRVSQIISKDTAERTVKERFILGYHEFICKACHNYQIQNNLIEDALSQKGNSSQRHTLSTQKKEQILETLAKDAR